MTADRLNSVECAATVATRTTVEVVGAAVEMSEATRVELFLYICGRIKAAL